MVSTLIPNHKNQNPKPRQSERSTYHLPLRLLLLKHLLRLRHRQPYERILIHPALLPLRRTREHLERLHRRPRADGGRVVAPLAVAAVVERLVRVDHFLLVDVVVIGEAVLVLV